ncbi:MAG: DEAD/DEAH box helicase family protein [Candidatus Eisenbacteria bacterium]
MIDLPTASRLLDFAARIGPGQRADEQLEGAVAVHNLLLRRQVAYLADEVGMGKTFVALGAVALFRHFQPDFRVLVIAPSQNIQSKWIKEMGNFVANNFRFPDLRVKGLDGHPVRPLVKCENLLDLTRESTLDADRDFFCRLTSFSLAISGKETVDPEGARRMRESLLAHLPWLDRAIFDLRSKKDFKDNFARAICCGLPEFDLVIVDEGHNLKHGFSEHVSARNRVLAIAMGHDDAKVSRRLFPDYGPRAKRVLFLSATPVEETYRHLWNQLDVFGLGEKFPGLIDANADEERKKDCAAEFLIRRVTSVRIGGNMLTKNLYRREWRRGGVEIHDEPITISDTKQRLIVALVQKKVSELLGSERFGTSFQTGMLASFESFLETAKIRSKDYDDPDLPNFDMADQTDDDVEREGIDVRSVNRLAKSYRKRFGTEMPHPKMDALVDRLADS